MEDDGPHLVPAGQVHRGDGADTLAVQDDVLGRDAESSAQRVPGRLYIGVEVLLRRLSAGHPVPTVVVTGGWNMNTGANITSRAKYEDLHCNIEYSEIFLDNIGYLVKAHRNV